MIFGVAIASLFIIEGLRKISRFVIWFFQWKQSQKWYSTHGRIIQSDLQNVLVSPHSRKSRNIDGSVRLVTAYTPNILYEYRAKAEPFQSRQIFLGQQFPSSLSFSNSFVEKYPIGKDVTVYYNPEKPEIAVLERERFKELLGFLMSGVLFLLIGFAILILVVQ